ncbi:MAG: anibiotic ABC transporter [Actinophytocola sp.]|uniref:ABC transporter permease n=1 Tax=Actinophytocola sp. TaxID=1872138 RepID=UPI001323E1BA|nr:ABC transporter permease [Actinophytocola sp.]MPZ80831.1 anibiotic ABC transporter [Actinophytocola sp.]
MTRAFTGTGVLTRLAVRRDRVRLPIWLVGLAALVGATASGIAGLYTTEADRVANAAVRAGSVVARAFNGAAPGSGVGALTVSEVLVYVAVLAALLNILTVVRHTRQNEELGRAELTGSAAVGRHAGLTSALLVACAADVVLAVLGALSLVVNGLPAAGSFAAGAAVGAVGMAFAAITAVTAQVAATARGATGLAGAVLGLAYLLRATGDALGETSTDGLTVTPAWPSWLSPIGWGQQLLPFGANRWWPMALFAAFAALALVAAARLSIHRDVGTGMLPVRRGRTRARSGMLSPLGLAWRLQRGVLFGWLVGIAVTGVAFGGLGDQADELFGSEQSAELMRRLGGGGSLVDYYFAGMMSLLGVIVAGYTMQAMLRMRADEVGGPAELMLATAVSRPRCLAAPVLCAVAGTALVLAVLGVSTGLAYGVVVGDVPGAVGDLLETTLAQLAPTLVLAGFVVAVFGLVPRLAAALSWAAFAVCLVVGQLGSLFGLPRAVISVSPFTHLPNLPADPLTAAPLLIMFAVAAALLTAGFLAFRRRSLAL